MEPLHTLIQLTDLHVHPEGAPPRPGTDTADLMARALQAIDDAGMRPGALLFTGDLAEHGDPAEYRRLRALVEPAAARIGAPAVYVAGNHDDRAALREHLLGVPATAEPLDHVVRLGDLRIIVLDSTVPGRGYGELTDRQLGWLRARLAEPVPAGTVLAVHHPPLPTAAPLSAVIGLQRPEDLAAVLAGSDVRIVLAGHTHVVSAGTVAGIPVWTGGALATTLDGLAPGLLLRGLDTPSVSRIDLFADAVLATSVPVAAEVAGTVPAEHMATRIAELRAALPRPP